MSTLTAAFEPPLTGSPKITFPTRLRQISRAIGFASVLAAAGLEFLILRFFGRIRGPLDGALWLQRICQKLVRVLDLRVRYEGERANSGLLVFNHVSYLDIVALAARHPVVFVSKSDVRAWPVIGWIAASAGTIFIDRTKRLDVGRITSLIHEHLALGVQLCIFPEGTSTDGTKVLPFRTSLLEPALQSQQPVTAGWVGYALEDGAAETEVCYWGDLTFGPHLWNLFSKRCIHGTVACAAPVQGHGCRKEFGRQLHESVCQLSERAGELKRRAVQSRLAAESAEEDGSYFSSSADGAA